jgi:WD40 repeat protein
LYIIAIAFMAEAGAGEKLKVFISYSRKDIAFAQRIVAALEACGIAPKIDTRDLPKLEDWRRELLGFIREADAVVFIVSPNSISSPVCSWELEQVAKLNKRLAPIVLERVPDDRIPNAIAKINYLFFSSTDFDTQTDELARALQTDLGWLKEHTRLGELARRWDDHKRASGWMLRGQELQDAEHWIAARPRGAPEPTQMHREFIAQSRRGATRRQRLTLAGSLVAAIIGFSLAGLAYWQRSVAVRQNDQLQHQQANMLGQLANTEWLRGNIDSALRLSVEGVRVDFALPRSIVISSPAAAQLAAVVSHADWSRALSGVVAFAAFSPDGTRIVTASVDKTARIWDAATGNEITTLRGHEDEVNSAAFSPDGTRIITASGGLFGAHDFTARIWDAATGKEISVLRGHERAVTSAAFIPDGTRIVTASYDNTARIWDAATGNEIKVLQGQERVLMAAALSPDGKRIVTGSADGTARIWDAATGTEIRVLEGQEGYVWSAAFSPDGTRIVTASGDPPIWDAATGTEIRVLGGHENEVYSAAFSPHGTRIVTASYDNTARVWDAATGKEISVLRGHESALKSAAFSPDGTRIVTASADKTARIWDAATGNEIITLRGHEANVNSAAFSPDGTRIITASGGLFDAHDFTARIWDAATGKEISVLRGHESVVAFAAFSPDGTRVVTASMDNTARIWDAATGHEIKVLRGHEALVVYATFSPDGTRVVTASNDGTARIWDARFATMSTKGLLAETCAHRLVGISKLSRDDMRLLGYSDDQPEIDVCEGVQ